MTRQNAKLPDVKATLMTCSQFHQLMNYKNLAEEFHQRQIKRHFCQCKNVYMMECTFELNLAFLLVFFHQKNNGRGSKVFE